MAVTQPGFSVTCFHGTAFGESCRIDAGSARHCLVAQGWFRSPTGKNNWTCARCATGYWVGPDEDLVKCCHLESLRERKRGTRDWRLTPQAAAETPEAVLTDIAQELENTGNRLVCLAARLRSATAQRSPVPE